MIERITVAAILACLALLGVKQGTAARDTSRNSRPPWPCGRGLSTCYPKRPSTRPQMTNGSSNEEL
jgi:hypothetical protein